MMDGSDDLLVRSPKSAWTIVEQAFTGSRADIRPDYRTRRSGHSSEEPPTSSQDALDEDARHMFEADPGESDQGMVAADADDNGQSSSGNSHEQSSDLMLREP